MVSVDFQGSKAGRKGQWHGILHLEEKKEKDAKSMGKNRAPPTSLKKSLYGSYSMKNELQATFCQTTGGKYHVNLV